MRKELAGERDRGRTTYAEVEESEADLNRFPAWLSKINARDCSQAHAGVLARAGLRGAADDLAAFEETALRTGNTESSTTRHGLWRLRAVDES